MRIMIYKGKYGNIYFDVSSQERQDKAFLALFSYIDNYFHYYDVYMDGEDRQDLLARARNGSVRAARTILDIRQDYEYEKWDTSYTAQDEEMDRWIRMNQMRSSYDVVTKS